VKISIHDSRYIRGVILKVLVTGSKGFVGKNICLYLSEFTEIKVLTFDRSDSVSELEDRVASADIIIHLAGENRPKLSTDFEAVNTMLTQSICKILSNQNSQATVVLASSIQALSDSDYGRSKLAAEEAVIQLNKSNGNPVAIYRLPGVFGKWCRPNYNSVVATFCHNMANDLPIQVNDSQKVLKLVHIDDVVASLVDQITSRQSELNFPLVSPEFEITIGALAEKIKLFQVSRTSLELGFVGEGLGRALYSTYISYLPKDKFSYDIPMHIDNRGIFVEFFKNKKVGQFSFLTAGPGFTRGSHYHHTKTEKFVVIKGVASFGFRHMITNEKHYLEVCGDEPMIVETIPGWAHDITNVGSEELIVMVWANEIYNRELADTIPSAV